MTIHNINLTDEEYQLILDHRLMLRDKTATKTVTPLPCEHVWSNQIAVHKNGIDNLYRCQNCGVLGIKERS